MTKEEIKEKIEREIRFVNYIMETNQITEEGATEYTKGCYAGIVSTCNVVRGNLQDLLEEIDAND